jgi:hypothetical protein
MDEQHESRRAEQYEMLEATAVDLGDESDLAEVLETSHEARKAVAARRRQRLGIVTGDAGADPEELDRGAFDR